MIITCENCSVKFNLNDELLKPTGSKVRCSKCRHIFTAFPAAPEVPEVEETPAVVPPPETEARETAEDGVRFSDFEKMLDEDGMAGDISTDGGTVEITETELEDDFDEELDLSGLDEMLESDDESSDMGDDVELDLDLDTDDGEKTLMASLEESDLDLDELDSLLGDEEAAGASDDLDLSLEMESDDSSAGDDLDFELEVDDAPAQSGDDFSLELDLDTAAVSEDEDLEIDLGDDFTAATDELELELEEKDGGGLDLDLDFEPETTASAGAGEAETGSDDLELVLDIDEDMDGIAPEDVTGPASEEATLESDLLETKTVGGVDDTDLDDLELDIDGMLAGDEAAPVKEAEGEEIDLSELEQTLEMDLLAPDGEEDDREDVELRLDDEEIEAGEDTVLESADDVDVDAIEEMLALDDGDSGETTSDELELEFELDEKDAGGDAARMEVEETVAMEDLVDEPEAYDQTSAELEEEVSAQLEKQARKPNKALLVILLVVLLIGGGIGAVIYLSSQGVLPPIGDMNIPYISDMFKTTPPQPVGKLEALQNSIKGDFVNNNQLGRMFVINGMVKNNTSKSHRSIRVKAELYSSGKNLAKTVIVYCGNSLSPEELVTLDEDTINNRLLNKFEPGGQYISLEPGATKPFMFVIPNLPDDLEEYKIMVAGSMAE